MQSQNSQPEITKLPTDESIHREHNDLEYEFNDELSEQEAFNGDRDSLVAYVEAETAASDAFGLGDGGKLNRQDEQHYQHIDITQKPGSLTHANMRKKPAPISKIRLGEDESHVEQEFTNDNRQQTSTKQPTTIHLVDGEKGGCGKSFLSRAFIEYCISIGLDITVVDADISNKDISKIYSGIETAFFSDDEKQAQQADKIFDLAFEKSVIVNLPAQVYTNVTQWIQRNDLIELGKENSITFVKWFVCSGGVDSVNFFLKSLEDLGDEMTHVFVRNMGLCDDWSYIEQMSEFIAAQSKYNFTVMDFPKFPFWERNQVDRLGATFEDALAHHELGVVSKQRVKNFLKQAYAAFKETGLVR
ncbi:mobilization protein MobD-like protein (plasmid) [Fischerella sp. NIES-4106]|nr:mobilization protein MobD-like protein [Fischerella sp. NIES-4106]